jgi:hypothetical protein
MAESGPWPHLAIMSLCRVAHIFAVVSTACLRAMPSVLLGRPRPPDFTITSKATRWKWGFLLSLPCLSWIAAT